MNCVYVVEVTANFISLHQLLDAVLNEMRIRSYGESELVSLYSLRTNGGSCCVPVGVCMCVCGGGDPC